MNRLSRAGNSLLLLYWNKSEDEDYVAFVEKALEIWQTDPLYGEHYHQTRWIQVVGEGSHANTIKGPTIG